MVVMRSLISPNFNERAGGVSPTILILHYTGTHTGQEAENYYMNLRHHAASGPISPHYMIDKDGTITQFVAEDKRAWHAGKAWWGGCDDINSHSIGIELVNPGHERGYQPFPPEQMAALAALTQDILSRQNIPPHRVLGHSDIAPLRKPDPGELMDWNFLAAQGVGLWPEPEPEDYAMSAFWLENPQDMKRAFTEYGYDPKLDDSVILRAFQRHYQTEIFKEPVLPLYPDRETAGRLHWLLRQKNAFAP